MTKVKICGNTKVEDVRLAIKLGADFIGLIFAESKRKLSVADAAKIIKEFPTFNQFVGVFMDQSERELLDIASSLKLKWIQLHGSESAHYSETLMTKGFYVIKTFHIGKSFDLSKLKGYNTPYFLFDTESDMEKGGSGKVFNWDLIRTRSHNTPFFLAGGLTIENVSEAIRKLQPFAVDVAGGVEKSPGIKSPELLEKFISTVKSRVAV